MSKISEKREIVERVMDMRGAAEQMIAAERDSRSLAEKLEELGTLWVERKTATLAARFLAGEWVVRSLTAAAA